MRLLITLSRCGFQSPASVHDCTNASGPVPNQALSLLHDVVDTPLQGYCLLSLMDEMPRREPQGRNGGVYRDRTDDILLAKQALSQLS